MPCKQRDLPKRGFGVGRLPMIVKRAAPNKASLGVWPNPLRLVRALVRPNQPFVMINMLSYKEQATGDYAHLTGQEAYEVYARSVESVQAPLGSRLLWSGQIHPYVTESMAPAFDAIGLLEYASPKAFVQANATGKSNTRARAAGLKGQWLIASTTLEEGEVPGLDEGHVVVVELSGGMSRKPEAIEQWHEVRQSIYRGFGATTLWRGRCDHHILGASKPEIEDVLVTWFSHPDVLEAAVRDARRTRPLQSISPYWMLKASTTMGLLPELSGTQV